MCVLADQPIVNSGGVSRGRVSETVVFPSPIAQFGQILRGNVQAEGTFFWLDLHGNKTRSETLMT